jgi:hypothetical protein
VSEESQDAGRLSDAFERAVTILLGLAALGAACSGYQGSLWNGKSAEAYGEAATMSIKASSEHDRAEMDIARDFESDLQAKERILEALDAKAASDKIRLAHFASYLYAVEMSQIGYTALKLPPEFHTAGDLQKHEGIPLDALETVLERRLDSAYEDAMLVRGKSDYAAADKRFEEGRQAGTNNDRFELNTVVFTVSLFFGGLGLVFKSRIRWYILVAATLALALGAMYLARTPWA